MSVTEIISLAGVLIALFVAIASWLRQRAITPHEVLNMEATRAKIVQETIAIANKNASDLMMRIEAQDKRISGLEKVLDAANVRIMALEEEVGNLYRENEIIFEWGKQNAEKVRQLGGQPIPFPEKEIKNRYPRTNE